MRKIICLLCVLYMIVLACSGGEGDSYLGLGTGVKELTAGQRLSGTIGSEGDVDWYHYRAVEANNVLQVRCTSETLRSDVDLLVSIYRGDADGDKVLIYADHAPEDSLAPADLTLNTYIDQPRDIYISVRDLLDDDASDNPYYISVDFAGSPEGNENFAQAPVLSIDSDDCPIDRISFVGDIDCYTFTSTGGTYDVAIDFSPFPDTRVQLSVDLYDSSGELIDSRRVADEQTCHLLHWLGSGEYFIQVDDYGRDHFDNASTYQVCVNSVSGSEENENDSSDDAEVLAADEYDRDYALEGALDYSLDQDWYRISPPEVTSGFKVMNLRISADTQVEYAVAILDEDEMEILSHDYRGGSAQYQTQIRLEDGEYYLKIQASDSEQIIAGAPYTATVTMHDISDEAEVEPNDNDSISTADPLTPTSDPAGATSGKIGYRHDEDWYALTIPAHAQPQVLEVFFSAPVSQVEYAVFIMGSSLEKTLVSTDASSSATDLRTSLLIPANDEPAVYSIEVRDYQDDDGDDVAYAIRVDLKDIPAVLPAVAAGTPPYGSDVEYYCEITEPQTPSVELQYNAVTQEHFGYDTALLDLPGAAVAADQPEAGLTTLTFPWIAGYIDYQGDQDFFQIDYQPLDSSEDWYYGISVELYAPASDVEYVWKFYPDRNDNEELAYTTSEYDGYIACAGDTSLEAAVLSITTPGEGDDPFWVGDPWQGPAYFSISDFNYLITPQGDENELGDDDWGGYGSAPYYFRVTIVYHPGESNP
ncbi:MAG: hypothetical protein JXM72_09930 [Deltaproteobacteria bacterium]|nr:hypothetical protein [Deltaproteobacteria bacterium]